MSGYGQLIKAVGTQISRLNKRDKAEIRKSLYCPGLMKKHRRKHTYTILKSTMFCLTPVTGDAIKFMMKETSTVCQPEGSPKVHNNSHSNDCRSTFKQDSPAAARTEAQNANAAAQHWHWSCTMYQPATIR